MSKLHWWGFSGVFAALVVGAFLMGATASGADDEDAIEATPPADQEFIGTKKCSSCHFDQFLKWKQTKHASSFKLLPEKYQEDEKCLKCHTTGFGKPGGYKTSADTDLQNTSCEACHGPGSKHAELTKTFAKKKLTPDEEKIARDSIWKVEPHNGCVKCHKVQGHHKSETPPELKPKK